MKMTGTLLAALWLPAFAAQAAEIQDWKRFELNTNVGTYADDAGGKVAVAQVEGPAAGQKAVQMTAELVKWGGLWTAVGAQDLSKATALRFKAKAAAPGYFLVSLTDEKKVQVQATIRVLAEDWQDFVLPMGLFRKSEWQMPEAPKDGVFNPAKLHALNLSPRGTGKSVLTVGPIAFVADKVEARSGLMDAGVKGGRMMVQDFESLDAGAYGTFQDEQGSSVKVAFIADKAGKAAEFTYDLKDHGWGGAWMRAGDAWTGQDWNGAQGLVVKVHASAPFGIELAFNDANQNAYVAPAVMHDGKGWQELVVPFDGFQLNEWYQPPQAKKGAALDLSRIETFNINVKATGKGSFKVDDVVLIKK